MVFAKFLSTFFGFGSSIWFVFSRLCHGVEIGDMIDQFINEFNLIKNPSRVSFSVYIVEEHKNITIFNFE